MRELLTDRLLLRPYAADDAGFIFDMYSRPEVVRFIGTTPQVMTDPAEAERVIARHSAYDDGVHGVWAITDRVDGRPFGSLLLKALPASGTREPLHPSGDTEIGWHLHPDAWGHGYATEAARRVLEHAWDSGLDQVLAVTNPPNIASQQVCRRIGMAHEGTTTAYYNAECELFSIARPARAASN